MNKVYLDEMISSIKSWLVKHDYNYIECNDVPTCLYVENQKINVLIRTFFRLCPINVRNMKLKEGQLFPITPQANVALLKAYSIEKDINVLEKIYDRVLSLQSPKVDNFALKQGIKIAISLYEDSEDDPTPLNTVWFGQFLLEDESGIVAEQERREILISIAKYLINELGYIDYGENGIYFRYGHHIKREVFNASAIISSFLIELGMKYKINEYTQMGKRGIIYICNKQNEEGSWFYAAKPERATIDCFHQAYILQALCKVQDFLDFEIKNVISKGVKFYLSLFENKGEYLIPKRYDKRYMPHNTWLFVKTDGRDIAEALIFFSKFYPRPDLVSKLLSYSYDCFFNKKKGYMYPERFIYGMNRIPYIEFQAWFLYAFNVVKQYNYE